MDIFNDKRFEESDNEDLYRKHKPDAFTPAQLHSVAERIRLTLDDDNGIVSLGKDDAAMADWAAVEIWKLRQHTDHYKAMWMSMAARHAALLAAMKAVHPLVRTYPDDMLRGDDVQKVVDFNKALKLEAQIL